MKRLILTLLLAASPLAACSGPKDADAQYREDLANASSQARAKLSFFWQHYEAPEIGEYDFALKVALPRKDGQSGTEDTWVENIARRETGGELSGELRTDPLYLTDLKRGSVVEFTDKQILDWAFFRGQELVGHYTTRVMLPKMPPEQAEGLKSMFGENPK